MATGKKAKQAATDDELSKLFEGLGDDANPPSKAPKTTVTKSSQPPADPSKQSEQDLLAELDNLAAERPASRPHTPRILSNATTAQSSPKKSSGAAASGRTSEDRQNLPRKSGDSTRSFHTSFTPTSNQPTIVDAAEPEERPTAPSMADQAQQTGGGWWGGIFATASAAVKQAEAAYKEIQKNEEAQRWAEQVRGNVGALRDLGGELRSRALPTFTSIMNTLAPPISTHERLQIHITHDLINYPSLDPLIYSTFSRVMAQVEGGDLMVIQRGHESSPRRGSNEGTYGAIGWNDGPWWRSTDQRSIGAVKGVIEGTKLVRVSAESYANEYFASRGGLEAAAKQATETLSESNPVRSSDIFLAIQAISHTARGDLFGGSSDQEKGQVEDPDDKPDDLIGFAIYLYDPIHSITFHTVSQWVPQKWIDWIDASSLEAVSSPGEEKSGFFARGSQEGGRPQLDPTLPESIAEIIESGGVDPREWVAEWLEEILALSVGVVAQRYVARRMGVGEGGIGRGKRREEIVESGGGEAARAI